MEEFIVERVIIEKTLTVESFCLTKCMFSIAFICGMSFSRMLRSILV